MYIHQHIALNPCPVTSLFPTQLNLEPQPLSINSNFFLISWDMYIHQHIYMLMYMSRDLFFCCICWQPTTSRGRLSKSTYWSKRISKSVDYSITYIKSLHSRLLKTVTGRLENTILEGQSIPNDYLKIRWRCFCRFWQDDSCGMMRSIHIEYREYRINSLKSCRKFRRISS